MSIEIHNYTPKDITILKSDGDVILKTEGIAQAYSYPSYAGTINGIRITRPMKATEVEGLPDERPDHFYVVDYIVKEILIARNDLLVLSEPEIDKSGIIKGYKSLSI